MRKRNKAQAVAQVVVSPAVPVVAKVDRAKFAPGTCGSCRSCDVRSSGYCKDQKTVDALDGWDRVIVHVGKFGCVNWEKL